jgi:hypothetical protein
LVDFSSPPRQRGNMKHASFLLVLALAGCGEAVRDDHFANEVRTERVEPAPGAAGRGCGSDWRAWARALRRAARLGRLAPCPGRPPSGPYGAVRHERDSGTIPPVPASSSARARTTSAGLEWSMRRRGTLSPACGVSRPVASRRGYEGPCRSGWVSSAFVKQIAG